MDPTLAQYVAVKALITNGAGKILVLKQSDTTITGAEQYHPPGGIANPGEALEACLLREIKEELGVAAHVNKLATVTQWQAEREQSTLHFVGVFYECTLESTDFTLESEEVSEALWIGSNELDSIQIMEPSKAIIKSYLEQHA